MGWSVAFLLLYLVLRRLPGWTWALGLYKRGGAGVGRLYARASRRPNCIPSREENDKMAVLPSLRRTPGPPSIIHSIALSASYLTGPVLTYL
jgi:hypothetical protein